METFKSYLNSGYLVIYYNPGGQDGVGLQRERRRVFGPERDQRTYHPHIYYNSSDVMTPTEVELDSSGERYRLDSSEMQFAFSMYGTLEVGDRITLIYSTSTSADGMETCTVMDYVDDDID